MNETIVQAIAKLHGSRKLLFQILEMLPIPIGVFEPGGINIFFNRAGIELNNIRDPSLLVGKYNLLSDPVYSDQRGIKEEILRGFSGETVSIVDFVPPIQDLVDRGIVKEKPFEKAFMDLFIYPILDRKKLAFLVCVFLVKSLYQGRPDVAKTKEYISKHWQEKFDPQMAAKSVNMSVRQLYKLFKQDTGMTPGEYYKKCKVDHLKEKLADKSISVKEAFAACNESNRGAYARIFKKIAGISPGAYRKSI